jgi:uncharacterized membrane protein
MSNSDGSILEAELLTELLVDIDQAQHPLVPAQPKRRNLPLRHVYDLLALFAAALLAPVLLLLPFPWLRVPLGLALVLFAPGYALTAALFVRRASLDGVARAGMSFGLSVAIIPVLALVLNATPWGLRPLPIALALTFWVLAFGSVAMVRRYHLAELDQAYLPPRVDPPRWWRALCRTARARYVLGALALVGVVIAAALALRIPDPTKRLTEFYATDSQGLTSTYQRNVSAGSNVQIQLGITNHEGEPAHYRVEAREQDQVLSHAGPLLVEDGKSWNGSLRFALAQPGDNQQIDILLFRENQPTPYRQLRLWINVQPGAR